MDLSVQLAPKHKKGLLLKNPVMPASGTFGYGTEFAQFMDIQKLGAVVCKGTTLKPREGNPHPRIMETEGGILNSIGLQNIGVDALVREKAPVWATWQVPVIVNIAGESINDYVQIAQKMEGVPGISGIEVNISCPNIDRKCVEFGANPQLAAEVTSAVRAVTTLPLLVKLTPNTGELVGVAQAVAQAGADAVTLINSLRGMALDIKKRKPVLGNVTGGLSGPAIKPVALAMVYQVAGVVDIPVIGVGGIMTTEDALEFIMAGASAVQVGTANFVNTNAMLDIISGIEAFMKREGIEKLSDLIGCAHK